VRKTRRLGPGMPSAPSEAVFSLESVAAQCGHKNNADVVGAIIFSSGDTACLPVEETLKQEAL
jgi:hypothetical protein